MDRHGALVALAFTVVTGLVVTVQHFLVIADRRHQANAVHRAVKDRQTAAAAAAVALGQEVVDDILKQTHVPFGHFSFGHRARCSDHHLGVQFCANGHGGCPVLHTRRCSGCTERRSAESKSACR